MSVWRDEAEASYNAKCLVIGAFILQFSRFLSLLTVALFIAEAISTYSYIIHLFLFHDRDIVWILRRRKNASYKRQDDEDLRDKKGQNHFTEEQEDKIPIIFLYIKIYRFIRLILCNDMSRYCKMKYLRMYIDNVCEGIIIVFWPFLRIWPFGVSITLLPHKIKPGYHNRFHGKRSEEPILSEIYTGCFRV